MSNDIEAVQLSKLQGKYKHYCNDWDGMAIDETCPEFSACTCYSRTHNYEVKVRFTERGQRLFLNPRHACRADGYIARVSMIEGTVLILIPDATPVTMYFDRITPVEHGRLPQSLASFIVADNNAIPDIRPRYSIKGDYYNVGYIDINKSMLKGKEEIGIRACLFKEFHPYAIEQVQPGTGVLRYFGTSTHFEERHPGDPIPRYIVQLSTAVTLNGTSYNVQFVNASNVKETD